MKPVIKFCLNISVFSLLSFNTAIANTTEDEHYHALNSSVEFISQNQTESNRQILELQNKLESLTRKLDTIKTSNDGPKIPAGTVVAFVGKNIPKGWLLCDGRPIARKGEYQALFDSIGTAHGQGDGSTTFHLPDYRGLFLRGVLNERSSLIDPSASTRGSMNAGGNTGNKIGSYQGDSFAEHSHNSGSLRNSSSNLNYSGIAKPDNRNLTGLTDYADIEFSFGRVTRVQLGVDNGESYGIFSNHGNTRNTRLAHKHSYDFNLPDYSFSLNTTIPAQTISGTTANQGSSETRPKNAYVNYIIKY